LLEIFRRSTPTEYHAPFFDDPGGAIAIWRSTPAALAYLAERVDRQATRQLLRAPEGKEGAGPEAKATFTAVIGRVANLDQHRFAPAGSIVFEGPRGRTYRSTHDVEWFPFDPEASKPVVLRADQRGEYGNLEWIGNDAGDVVLPDGTVDTSYLDFANHSDQRAGVDATLTVAIETQLQDTGLAPTFRDGDVGLYLRINIATTPANVGRVVQVLEVFRAEDPDEGLYPRTAVLSDQAIALVTAAIQDDGGGFTDYTAEAQSTAAGDVPLLPSPAAVGDAFYFAAAAPWNRVRIDVSQALVGDLALTWEFWNGAIWDVLPIVNDDTLGWTIAGRGFVQWTIPGSWASTTVAGKTGYFVRSRVSAFTSQAQQPLASLAASYTFAPLIPEVTSEIGWQILDWRELGFAVESMTAPSGGRDDTLGQRVRERGLRRWPTESDAQLAHRAGRAPDYVTAPGIERTIRRFLEPFGTSASVCDVSRGFTGLFWDVPRSEAPEVVGAWDLYATGDAFPTDQTLLPLDWRDAHKHFFVKIPLEDQKLGDFGNFWDEGPTTLVEGAWLGPAWDSAYLDGYAWLSGQLLLALEPIINEIKPAGVTWEYIPGVVPTCP
jgi:hypothetical protein